MVESNQLLPRGEGGTQVPRSNSASPALRKVQLSRLCGNERLIPQALIDLRAGRSRQLDSELKTKVPRFRRRSRWPTREGRHAATGPGNVDHSASRPCSDLYEGR